MPIVKVLVAVLMWGASFVLTKRVLAEIPPVTLVWLRFSMGVVVLGGAAVAKGDLKWVSRRDLAYFVLLGFLGVAFHQWLQSNGLVTAQATTSAWIVATSPVFIALLGRFVLGERLTWLRWTGIAVAAAGVLLVVSRGRWEALVSGVAWGRGDLLVLVSALNWAVFSVLSRRGLSEHSAVRMMLFVMAAGWLFVTAWFIADHGWTPIPQLDAVGWFFVTCLGVVGSGFAYIFWYDALQALPAARVGIFLYIEPLVTVALAAATLHEGLSVATAVGGAGILGGVWLVNRSAR
jgi:drug/metabolite transporter (DMT)-like permease